MFTTELANFFTMRVFHDADRDSEIEMCSGRLFGFGSPENRFVQEKLHAK